MHEDMRANARIGKNETNGVVDASGSEFVGIEEQRSNGEARGVGAGALISAAGRRIDAVEIPHRDEVARRVIVRVVGLIGLVEFAMAAVDNDEMAVLLIDSALIALAALQCRLRREAGMVATMSESAHKTPGPCERAPWSGCVCLQHANAEVDLHPSCSPSARIREPVDDGGGLGIEGAWLTSCVQMEPGGKYGAGGAMCPVLRPGP